MAAGTEVTQPVSVIDAVYKKLPSGTQCKGMGKGFVADDHKGQQDTCQIKVDSIQPDSYPSVSESSAAAECNPVIRSGVWSDIGAKQYMEDEHVRIDDLVEHLGPLVAGKGPKSYYGVFDGHGGKDAAQFVKDTLLKYIVQDVCFPTAIKDAVHHAFSQTDQAFAEACTMNEDLSSGTTAITVLVVGRRVFVANVGDCRAVLSRRGKAIDMSRDHKPSCMVERRRIEALGGFVDDGYLNGQLGVARALGDWHMEGLKGVNCPLIAEPEVREIVLTDEDEFMIIGCDGLWDVFTSQYAVEVARRRLQQHNDPERCCRELVAEALRRNASDNLTVLLVCFQVDPPPKLVRNHVRKSVSTQGLMNLQNLLDQFP